MVSTLADVMMSPHICVYCCFIKILDFCKRQIGLFCLIQLWNDLLLMETGVSDGNWSVLNELLSDVLCFSVGFLSVIRV